MAELSAGRDAGVGGRGRPPQTLWTPDRRQAVVGYLFAAPFIVGFLALTVGPMLFSLYTSFTRYNIVDPPQWIGLQNYQFIFTQDDRFRLSLGNTVYYVVIKTPLVISLAIVFATLMNIEMPGQKVFRTLFYLPTVITGVAAVLLWQWILNPQGLLNRFLGLFGVPGPNWFLDPAWAKNGLIVMALWYIGSPILILLAALKGIPQDLHDVAAIDGAGPLRKFWSITVPLISPTIFFLVITNVIGAFQVFNSAYILGGRAGDPAQSLLFYELYLYQRAFGNLEMGFAAALAWILFAIVMVVTGVQLWLSNRWVYYES